MGHNLGRETLLQIARAKIKCFENGQMQTHSYCLIRLWTLTDTMLSFWLTLKAKPFWGGEKKLVFNPILA